MTFEAPGAKPGKTRLPGRALLRRVLAAVPVLIMLAAAVSILAAAASLGLIIGWSIGQAGLDSDVLAAVLPVILTSVAGGAATVVFKVASGWSRKTGEAVVVKAASGWSTYAGEDREIGRRLVILAAVSVIAFSTAYLAGTIIGKNANERGKLEKEIRVWKASVKAAEDGIARRYDYLVRCTRQLVRLNRLREEANRGYRLQYLSQGTLGDLGLGPFTLDQVCIGLVRRGSSEHPLVAPVNDESVLPVPAETEEKHYEYLETCTIDQAVMNRGALKAGRALVTIEEICPGLAATPG